MCRQKRIFKQSGICRRILLRRKPMEDTKSVQSERRIESVTVAVAVAGALLGVYLLFFNATAHRTVAYALGILYILEGIVHCLGYFFHVRLKPSNRYDFPFGTLTIIVGILLITMNERMIEHFPMIVGLLLLFKAVTWLQTAM